MQWVVYASQQVLDMNLVKEFYISVKQCRYPFNLTSFCRKNPISNLTTAHKKLFTQNLLGHPVCGKCAKSFGNEAIKWSEVESQFSSSVIVKRKSHVFYGCVRVHLLQEFCIASLRGGRRRGLKWEKKCAINSDVLYFRSHYYTTRRGAALVANLFDSTRSTHINLLKMKW